LLVAGVPGGPHDVGVRSTFADVGATIAELLGVATSGLAGRDFSTGLGF